MIDALHTMSGRRWKPALAGSLAMVAAVLVFTPTRSVLAFDNVWHPPFCTSATQAALWDDAPGAGANNEAGFFWLAATPAVSTTCTVESNPPSLSTNQFSMVTVRAAVNDGAKLFIELREGAEPEHPCEGPLIQELAIFDTSANSGFVTLEELLPPGYLVQAVCVRLNDVGAGQQRASALIDEIKIWSSGPVSRARRASSRTCLVRVRSNADNASAGVRRSRGRIERFISLASLRRARRARRLGLCSDRRLP